jgi:hypothetical protein
MDTQTTSLRQQREQSLTARHDYEREDLEAAEKVASVIVAALYVNPPDIGDASVMVRVGSWPICLLVDRDGAREEEDPPF